MESGYQVDQTHRQLLLAIGYSKKAVTILEKNVNMGKMDHPSITEQHQGKCGDILILSLKINENVIKDARYEYIGCAGLQSCASALCEMIKEKTLSEAQKIEVDDIIQYLEGIPHQKYECAMISRDTLRKAIDKWKTIL
jgi:NifU-like protein involved in Fe-S cluster formation